MGPEQKDLAIRDDVVVEAEIAGEPAALTAFVTNVLTDALWLALRAPDTRFLSLEPGQNLHLTFIRGRFPVVAESAFVKRLGGDRMGTERSRVFAVVRPQGIEAAQRRMHVRVDVERTVFIRIPAPLSGSSRHIGTGRTLNVSAGGLQMVSDLPLLLGDWVTIALALRANDLVTTPAQVVRIDEEPASTPEKPRSRVAVKFDRISEADQERIACHLLAERRKKRTAPERLASPERPVEPERLAEPEDPPAAGRSADEALEGLAVGR